MKRVIDAKNAVIGRLATVVAKSALLGDEIAILNCESAVMSGTKKVIESKWRARVSRGQPTQGPFYPRMPDRFVKRIIRGMIPYKQPKGRVALDRVKCYLGVPPEFRSAKVERIAGAELSQLNSIRFVTIENICKFLGGKVR